MSKRSIILYWLLLLVPSILIGVSAVKLLRHEQERMIHEKWLTAQERAQAIGDTLRLTVGAVQDELTASLKRIAPDRIQETLASWETHNPLIRNVFIWDKTNGLIIPPNDSSATSEERRFIRRYSALITGRIPWQKAGKESEQDHASQVYSEMGDQENQNLPQSQAPSKLSKNIQKFKEGRNRLMQLAKGKVSQVQNEELEDLIQEAISGWIPWFEENNLYILGWAKQNQNQMIYGLELEVMALLSRLLIDFPLSENIPKGMVYALVDGGGRFLIQAGSEPLETSNNPDLMVSLAPELPHWQVAVFFVDKKVIGEAGRSFTILSGLLLGILILAIIFGGSMLTWQAYRNFKDAQRKTSFVSNVSHELKTPLTSIRMYGELLSEGRIKDQKKKLHYLQVIVAESQRLTRLVNNVLDFSRLEQGRKKYHYENLEITVFLKEIINTHQLQIEKAGMELKSQIPDTNTYVTTDRDSIEQVLLNLMDNAIKYAASGRELLISLDPRQHYCEINFKDRGPGVPLEHRKDIFEKFHRVDNSLTSQKPGSGLGLSIARRLLKELGGDLKYIPREGGGSCFTILIPCEPGGNKIINHNSGKKK